MHNSAPRAEKDVVSLVKGQNLHNSYNDSGTQERRLHIHAEIGLQHDHGVEEQPFYHQGEEPRLHPHPVALGVEEHPSRCLVEQHLSDEIAQDFKGKDADDEILVNDERLRHIAVDIKEEHQTHEQAALQGERELEPYLLCISVMSLSSPVGRLKKFLAWRIMKSRDLVNATTPKMKHSNSSTVMMLSLAVL